MDELPVPTPVLTRAATRLRAALALSAACAIAAGCALSDPPSPAQVTLDALPQGTTIPPAWVAEPATSDVANDWLRSFNDPALEAAVAEAIANNTNLRQAAAQVEIARQAVVVVGAKLLPRVGLALGASTTRDEDHDDWFNSNSVIAGAAWEVDVWGRLRSQEAAAQARFEATALDYAYARESLAATTANAWFLNVEALQLLDLAEQNAKAREDLYNLVKLRRAAGRVADLDVAEASGTLNNAEGALRTAQGLVGESRRALELLLGRYPSAELRVSGIYAALPPPVPAGLPSSLLDRRPDLVAAQRRILAAFRAEQAAKLTLLPSISLGLEGGRIGDGVLSLLRLNPWLFRAGVGVEVPIYEGGALQARVKIATAQQDQAVAAYGSAALSAFREVENALMQESLLIQRLQFGVSALRDHTQAVRIATIQYQAGATDLLSVLQLQSEQFASEDVVIKLRSHQLINRVQLHLALGGGFDVAPAIPPGAPPDASEEKQPSP